MCLARVVSEPYVEQALQHETVRWGALGDWPMGVASDADLGGLLCPCARVSVCLCDRHGSWCHLVGLNGWGDHVGVDGLAP